MLKDIGIKNYRPMLLLQHKGNEVWIKWEPFVDQPDEGVYGLYRSEACDDPIGEADTITDARQVAAWWFKELESS